MFTRTVVTADGIAKRPMISGGSVSAGKTLIRGSSFLADSTTHLAFGFVFAAADFPELSLITKLSQPGFESFLSYVRQHLSQRPAALITN